MKLSLRAADAPAWSRLVLAACTLLILIFQIAILLRKEFNWDEYYFLALVFQYRQGTLEQSLQTFHVHLFSWLGDLPWSDSDRIVAGRSVMLVLHIATLFFLYGMTRRLLSAQAALWSIVLYVSLQFVVIHATSFRADPLITFLLVGALYLLACGPLRFPVLLLSSLAFGLAVLVSLKSVMYLPPAVALVAFQLHQSEDRVRDLRHITAALAISLMAVAGAFHLHSLSLVPGSTETAKGLSSLAEKQFGSASHFTGLRFLLTSIVTNACFYLLVFAGVAYAVRTLFGKTKIARPKATVILLFATPLLFSLLYRNSFPYFYVFMMAPVSMVAGFAAAQLRRFWAAFALLAAASIFMTLPVLQRDQGGQREVETAVHQMFPTPVPYLDRCGMITSFPWKGFFMSSWGLDNYLKAGEPRLAQAISSRQPVFLLATHPVIEEALGLPPSAPTGNYSLLPEDARALNENFVHHWGPIWVAGKQLPAAHKEAPFTVVIEGQYTFEAPSSGTLDGKAIAPGTAITLPRGPHSFAGPAATLRFGVHLARPAAPPPKPFFLGF